MLRYNKATYQNIFPLNMLNFSYFILFLLLLTVSCSQHRQNNTTKKQAKTKEDNLVEVNKYLVTKDAEAIKSFVKRRNWDMKITKTGLWFMIYEQGAGTKAEKGKVATLSYTLSLLDGTVCYNVDSLNPKRFRIGQGGVEQGLEEGILLLRKGDKARFIMPPYQAHGLLGDDNKIPARSTIVYDLQVLGITEN